MYKLKSDSRTVYYRLTMLKYCVWRLCFYLQNMFLPHKNSCTITPDTGFATVVHSSSSSTDILVYSQIITRGVALKKKKEKKGRGTWSLIFQRMKKSRNVIPASFSEQELCKFSGEWIAHQMSQSQEQTMFVFGACMDTACGPWCESSQKQKHTIIFSDIKKEVYFYSLQVTWWHKLNTVMQVQHW